MCALPWTNWIRISGVRPSNLCFNGLSIWLWYTLKLENRLGWSTHLPFPSDLWSVTIAKFFLVNISGLQLLPADRKTGLLPHALLSEVCYTETSLWVGHLYKHSSGGQHNTQPHLSRKLGELPSLFKPMVPNFGCTLKSPGEILNAQCLGYTPDQLNGDWVEKGWDPRNFF